MPLCKECHKRQTPKPHPENPDTGGLCWRCWDAIQLEKQKKTWSPSTRAKWKAIENASLKMIIENCQVPPPPRGANRK